MSEKERNLRIAESIYAQFAWNGHTFRDGECVALLDGKIVAVAGNPDDAISELRTIDPDPHRGMVIEVSQGQTGTFTNTHCKAFTPLPIERFAIT